MAFNNLISESKPEVQQAATQLRDIVLGADARIKEKFFGDNSEKAYYTLNGDSNVFAAIQPVDDRCRLYLHDLDKLNHDDFKVAGAGDDQMPYIIFENKDEADQEKVQNLVRKAVEAAG